MLIGHPFPIWFLFIVPLNEFLVFASDEFTRNEANCGIGQFSCDGQCVPLKWMCDGEPDCASGSDELLHCARCSSDEFHCQSGRCLPKVYLCDGTPDCGANGVDDNSDEDPSICLHKSTCPPNFFSCRHEARCIHLSQFCNGIVDCNDHSDEHEKCDDWHNVTCHYGVGLTIDGPVCYCPTEQIVNGDGCDFEDKCTRPERGQAPICSQMCQNLTNGVFECDCYEDFRPNGSHCDPRDSAGNFVTVVGNSFIMTSSVNWDEFAVRFQRTINHNRRVITATVDTKRNWICYLMAAVKADPSTYAFMECSRITKKAWKVVKTDITASFPFDEVRVFRHDPIGDNWLFLVDRTKLMICKNDEVLMNKCKIILDDVDIEDFVIDSTIGLIFYSTTGRNGGVWRVSYQNQSKISMSKRKLQMPGGLAVDSFTKTLYYSDRYFERIFAVDYGNTWTVRSIVHDKRLKYSTSLTYFADYLYVPSRAELLRIDTITSQMEVVDFHAPILGFFVNHNLSTPTSTAPPGCSIENGGCPDICVSDKNASALCLCADGLEFRNGNCSTSKSIDSLLLYSRQSPKWIHGVRIALNNTEVISSIPSILSPRGGAVFTVDPSNSVIYFYDDSLHTIFKRSIEGGDVIAIAKSGIHHLTCIAVDSSSGNLYYGTRPSVSTAGITVFHPRSPDKRAQIVKTIGGVYSVVVDSMFRFLFYSTTTQFSRHNIVRANLDGTQSTVLIGLSSFNPITMAVDVVARKVYWFDPSDHMLHSIGYNGENTENLPISSRTPFSLAVRSGSIFFSDNDGIRLVTSIGDGDYDIKTIDSLPVASQLYLYENKTIPVSRCLQNNGGCEQLCFPRTCSNLQKCDDLTRKCSCADDFVIDKTNSSMCIAKAATDVGKCEPSQFMCRHTEMCISKDKVCDKRWDCYDGSDEDIRDACVRNFSCSIGEFRCDSMTCIPTRLVCDGRADCEDRSDESWAVCKGRVNNCANGTFACAPNRQCLPNSWRCDGRVDCPDRSDERNCEPHDCDSDHFQCLTGQCIPLDWTCDGRVNCRDGSDELHCHEGCRIGREFRCDPSSACLHISFKCDGIVDCENGLDEQDCANISSTRFCRKLNEYLCKREQRCIRRSAVCDGVDDCRDGQDERKCKGKKCAAGLFACRSRDECVSSHLECDGVPDCSDGSDEHEHCSFNTKVVEARCKAPDITCRTFTGIVCLPAAKICDGTPDCFDAKDEEFCGYEQQRSCLEMDCEDVCYVQPHNDTYTTVCGCGVNRTLTSDGRTCEASHRRPCDFGSCSQHCLIHSNRTSHCFCEAGFQMLDDGFTCRAIDSRRPFILYSDRHSLMYLASNSFHAVPILSQLENAVSFDYLYHVNGTISVFWADVTLDTIFRIELNRRTASNPQAVISTGLSTVEGIAVDWMNELIYWTDSHHDHIQVARIDGSMRTTVVNGNIHNPRDIVVDPSSGLMFWTDWQEENPRIERASMAGNNRTVIFKVSTIVNGGWPNGLVCDIIARRIYWVDAKSDTVHTVTYDGTDHIEVLRDHVFSTHPFSVDLFENHVYWTDWRINAIVRANKWNGSSITAIFHTPIRPFYVKVVHRTKQPRTIRNPCAKSTCSHLCLLDGADEFTCRCPHFMQLKKGSPNRCEEVKSVVLLSTKNSVFGVNIESANDVIFATAGFQDITAIAASNEEVFIYDAVDDILWSYSTLNEEKRTMISGDLSQCFGLAIDRISGVVYYTSYSEEYAAIYAVNHSIRRSIIDSSSNKELRKPQYLVFLEESASLLWMDIGYNSPSFFVANGDGTNIRRIEIGESDELLKDVSSLVYDRQAARVLWLTSNKSLVVAMDIRTWKITSLIYANDSDIDTITVDEWTGSIFLMVDNVLMKKTFRSNFTNIRANSSNITKLSTKDPFRSATIMDRTMSPKCGLKSCSYLCLRSTKNRYECLCAQGFTRIGKNCIASETLLLTGDKLLSITNGSSSPAFLFHPTIAYKQWKKPAIDYMRELVYLISDFELWVTNLNGSSAERLLNTEDTLTSVAVDAVTGNVILGMESSKHTGEIFILDPRRISDNIKIHLVTDPEGAVRHIEMDPIRGLLFWSRGCIKKANADGSNVSCVVNTTTTSFVIDLLAAKLYYLEKSGEVRCVNYDGYDNQVVAFFSVVDTIQSELAIGDNKLYIIQRKRTYSSTLLVTELERNATGKFAAVSSYNTTATTRFRAAVVYTQKFADLQNPCLKNNGGCSHLCLISAGQPRCFCAYSILQADNSCKANPNFISYSHGAVVDFVSISPNSTAPRGALRYPEIPLGITIVEVDPDRNQLVLVDSVQNRIIIYRFSTNSWYSVADDVGEVKGISLDTKNREIYYTRSFPPSIWRLSLISDDPANYPLIPTRVALLGQDNKPRDIVVHPCRMLIFFTNVGIVPSIERMYYSGYKRERIVDEDIIGETRISIDFLAEKLYFTEITSETIYRVDFDGHNKEVVVSSGGRPSALAVMDNYLIYSRTGPEIVMVDKVNGLSERIIAATTTPVESIAVSTKDVQRCNTDVCASLSCSDECRLNARGEPHCVCRGDRTLQNDNITCIGSELAKKTCAMNEFLCMFDNRCIPYEETCDRYPDCAHGEDENVDMCSQRTCRPGYFNCGNGLCVTLSKKCNRNNDCLNFADEIDCECNADEFRCESGICISNNLTCDFKPDCNDASDEKNCPPRNCANSSDFDIPGLISCNGTTQCILPQWRCDGTNDCWDNSDEEQCTEIVMPMLPGLRPCLPDEFTCGQTKSCLPRAWVCDGQKDCGDGSDEFDCLSSCRLGIEFTCRSGDCIHIENKCDGKKHCPDGDDEENCDTPIHSDCDSVSFRCRNERCISLEWICDGADDCGDATTDDDVSSDEAHCADMSTACMSDEFRCRMLGTSYRSCLSNVLQCDGFMDCTDGSDENRTECAKKDRCRTSEFRCHNGQCIPKSWTCNELPDCSDQSDENRQMCTSQSMKCNSDEVMCVKDEVTTCISQEIICNQSHECDNLKSFMKTMCGVNECKFDLCEEDCVDLPFGYRCECRSPKVADPRNPARCILRHQCATSNCSQFCMEKGNGNYECACAKGYLLESDGHGCKLKSKLVLPMLLSVTSDGIRMSSLRDSYEIVPINSSSGRVLAFSVRLSSIYWIDENETVGRTFTNGTSMILHEMSVYCPDDLAVDEFSGNIYWTSKSRNAIMMSDSENRFVKTLYRRGPGVLPYALAIDSAHRSIFWSDIGKNPSLNRMSIVEDDGGVDVLLDSSLLRPTALAVDPFAKRLYWIEQALHYIGVCNYDGTNRRMLARKTSRGFYGMDIFGDFIYVSDFSKGTIERIRKYDASGNSTVLIAGLNHPKGIQVVHPEKWPQKNVQQPCLDESTCVQLCVPSNNRQGYQCLCRDGMRYDDGKCVTLTQSSTSSHVVVVDNATIRNFVLALFITGGLMMFFFHKNRSYIFTSPTSESHSWEIEGQERFPLSTVTLDGGVENPVFEPNEDTPMDPKVNDDELTA